MAEKSDVIQDRTKWFRDRRSEPKVLEFFEKLFSKVGKTAGELLGGAGEKLEEVLSSDASLADEAERVRNLVEDEQETEEPRRKEITVQELNTLIQTNPEEVEALFSEWYPNAQRHSKSEKEFMLRERAKEGKLFRTAGGKG